MTEFGESCPFSCSMYSTTRVYIAQALETPENVDHSTDDSVIVVNSSVAPIRDEGMYIELYNGLGMLILSMKVTCRQYYACQF